jgi:hypothetical protein
VIVFRLFRLVKVIVMHFCFSFFFFFFSSVFIFVFFASSSSSSPSDILSIFSETSPLILVLMADEEAGVLLLLQDELYAQYSRGSLHALHVSTAVADGCLVHADKTMILMEILPHFSPLK